MYKYNYNIIIYLFIYIYVDRRVYSYESIKIYTGCKNAIINITSSYTKDTEIITYPI